MTDIPTPPGLDIAGARLWKAIRSEWRLRPDEEVLLLGACHTADELERLEAALADAPLMVEGSQGQLRANPLIAEARQHRLALRQLLGALGIAEAESDPATRSDAGRRLARQRWGTRG